MDWFNFESKLSAINFSLIAESLKSPSLSANATPGRISRNATLRLSVLSVSQMDNSTAASVTNSEHNCAHVSTFGTIVAQKMSEKLQNEHNFINLRWSKKIYLPIYLGKKLKNSWDIHDIWKNMWQKCNKNGWGGQKIFMEISVAHFWAQFGKIVAHFNPIILVTLAFIFHKIN